MPSTSPTTARSASRSSSRQPDELRPQLLASLRRGMEKDYVGQMSRDVVRLLRADANPGELIWEAVAYGAPRADFGWGHAIASLTDCLAMTDRYTGDERALPIVQAIAGVAEQERDRPVNPLPDPQRVAPRRPPRRVPPFRRGRAARACAGGAARRDRAGLHRRRHPAVVHRHRVRSPAVVRPWRDLLAEGVPVARAAGLGAGRHRAAASRADDRVRHARGQVAVHEAVPPRPRATRFRRAHRGGGVARPALGGRRPPARGVARAGPHRGGVGGRRRAACRVGHRPLARHGDDGGRASACCATTSTASATSTTTSAGSTSPTA